MQRRNRNRPRADIAPSCPDKPSASQVGRGAALVVLFAFFLLVSAAPARASHTVTQLTVAPASLDAGASADVSVSMSFSYSSATEDLDGFVLHLPAGLLGNPFAVPRCSDSDLQADRCPADTKVGTTAVTAVLVGRTAPPVTATGDVYNAVPLGSELGRLGIVVRPPTLPPQLLSAAFTARTDGDYGLDATLRNLPRTLGTFDIQTTGISFTLSGVVQGRELLRNPSSCNEARSTVEGIAYDDPARPTASTAFTPANCAALAFTPDLAASVGGKGLTAKDAHPSFSTTVTQGPDQAGTRRTVLALPPELEPNNAAFGTVCTSDQFATASCPPASQKGTATVTTPILAGPLSGSVFVIQQPGQPIPSLGFLLTGALSLKLTAANTLLSEAGRFRIQTTLDGIPDVPIDRFTVTLDGGPQGVLTNDGDLCFDPEIGAPRLSVNVEFQSHSGKTTSQTKAVAVDGCPVIAAQAKPVISSLSFRRAQSSEPRLRIQIKRAPLGRTIRRVKVALPKDLRLRPRRVRRGASGTTDAGRLRRSDFRVRDLQTVEVRGLRPRVSEITVILRRGAIRPNFRVRTAVRAGRRPRLRFKAVVFDSGGNVLKALKRARAGR
jgi:hypothetical protein